SRVTPYFRHNSPPALVAPLPPIVDQGALAGSGGYQRPWAATAAFRSLFTTPGCTTQVMLSLSISSTWFIRDRSSTTPPSVALAPPDRPVPAPRGTTGAPNSAQVRTTWRTSASVRARTPATARPTGAHSASSWEMAASTSGSMTSRPSGSPRPSAPIRPAGSITAGGAVPGCAVSMYPTLSRPRARALG